MPFFHYTNSELHCEQLALSSLADSQQTPAYIYSQAALRSAWDAYAQALAGVPVSICYAVKANSNISLLRLLASWGSGFDIVSGGELERVLQAGARPESVVFSGVGKSRAEIVRALQVGIRALHVESEQELDLIAAIAQQLDCSAGIALRINPDLSVDTHAYIGTGKADSKFGVSAEQALPLYAKILAHKHLRAVGISAHLGSQIFTPEVYPQLAQYLLKIVEQLRQLGIKLEYLDLGGGLGVAYTDSDKQATPAQLLQPVLPLLAPTGLQLLLEPGRSLVAASAILLTRVLYSKRAGNTNYLIVDAAMNDLLRPALYQAWHQVQPVRLSSKATSKPYHIVGPICESGDFLALDRELPELTSGDLLAINHCGAYASSMASNYNSRNRACELLVDRQDYQLIRRRESYADQMRTELEA